MKPAQWIRTGGLLGLAAGLGGWLVLSSRDTVAPTEDQRAEPGATWGSLVSEPDAGPTPGGADAQEDILPHGDVALPGDLNAPLSPGDDGIPESGPDSPRDKAVKAWGLLMDQILESAEPAATADGRRVKEAFDRLDAEDQMEALRMGLNLLPDEKFAVLYVILYDKSEREEVLDAIFSDALNRSEEIKTALLLKLRSDPAHPMYYESVRILDLVGPDPGAP